VADPAKASGSEAEIEAAFELAYSRLRRRIEAMLALPLAELAHDKATLQRHLADIHLSADEKTRA
jgi:arsenate reductase